MSESINCNSCGAPVKPIWSVYVDCGYCGNTNRVLDNGKTIIENERKRTPRLSGRNVAPVIIQQRIEKF